MNERPAVANSGGTGRWRRFVVPLAVVAAVGAFALVSLRGGDADPEPVAIEAAGSRFDTIAEMTVASDLVVEGVIVSADDGRRITDPADPEAGLVTRLYQLEIREVFRGDDLEFALVEQEDTLLDGTPIVVNGLTPHQVGDAGFWFLVLGDSEEFPFSAVVNEQGRLLLSAADTIQTPLIDGIVDADELREALRTNARSG
ncbi:MAG: hypothetical protein AAGG08_06105 [Actinomycetota bacterium]